MMAKEYIDGMQPLTAQFLHQHKDNVVYEGIIQIGSPCIRDYDDYGERCDPYISFVIPVIGEQPMFMHKWHKIGGYGLIISRVLRLIDSNGTILYQSDKKPLEVKMTRYCDSLKSVTYFTVRFKVKKEEILELAKIFQKYSHEEIIKQFND